MRCKLALGLVLLLSVPVSVKAQDAFKLGSGVSVAPQLPIVLDLDYSGAPPEIDSPYRSVSSWKVRWTGPKDKSSTLAKVDSVEIDTNDEKVRLHVSGSVPTLADVRNVKWTILFDSPDGTGLLPAVVNSSPKSSTGKDCTDPQKSKPLFCPPSKGGTPDLSLSGNFLAAGGTKPIYSLELKGGIVGPADWSGFHPAVSMQVEINQNEKPPSNRTRFDPDSITGSFSLAKHKPVQKGPLYGLHLQFQAPEGEFSRKDPSSNVIVSGLVSFIFKAWQPDPKKPFYATIYPFVGLEAGHNLSQPKTIDKVSVDLRNYGAIVRGYLGSDACFAIDSKDRKSTDLSVTGSYRVRLPFTDEPFVETVHTITTVDMTTKARHWFEGNINYSPTAWKFFSFNVKYQYGSLPPLFSLVDHKVSVGLTLQAVQSNKASGTKLIQ
jgi:hypothetical protein